jgi:tungstate transport system ATP-binding protein
MTEIYRLENVERWYGDRRALHVPELSLDEGECLGIIGPSGAGKTTLLRLLAMLDRPTAGSLYYRGQSFEGTVPLEFRREITMVFQRAVLLDRTVLDNVIYGLRIRREGEAGRVWDTMKELGIDQLADQPAHSLSAGELQRAAVARALVLRPRVLLLDEPTANLDPDNVAILEQAIQSANVRDGTTVVLVSHNLHQICRLADSLAGILDGEMVEHGPVSRVVSQPRNERLRAFLSGGVVY